ncbi:hypothetical protein MRX96_019511 [Rhipicephalus microplus]
MLNGRSCKRTGIFGRFRLLPVALLSTRISPTPLFACSLLRCQGREWNEQHGLAKLPHHGAKQGVHAGAAAAARARLQSYSLGRPCLCVPARMTSVGGRTWPLPASPHAGGHAVLVIRVAAHEPAVALARVPTVAAVGRQAEAGKAHLAVAVDVVVRRPVTWAAQSRMRNRPAYSDRVRSSTS